MRRQNLALLSIGVLALGGVAAQAQSVISAHSGLIHLADGKVLVSEKPVEVKYGVFPEVKVNEILRTEEGRAEVLLTPGVFLRLDENSSFKMVSRNLSDTRVEALSGVMLLEQGEMIKDNSVTLMFKDKTIEFRKSGLYRLDANTGTFSVYQGEAVINGGGQSLTAKAAKQVNLNAAVLMAEKFDNKVGDSFYRWASRRAEVLAAANVSAARSARGMGSSFLGSSWMWNPWYGMFTFVPGSGIWNSPFGYSFWSPGRVIYAYYPGYYNGGSYGGGRSYGGGSGSSMSSGYSPSHSAASYSGSSGMGGFSSGGSVGGGSVSSGGGSTASAPASTAGASHSGHGR